MFLKTGFLAWQLAASILFLVFISLATGACALPAPTVLTPPAYKPSIAPCERPCEVREGRTVTFFGAAIDWTPVKLSK